MSIKKIISVTDDFGLFFNLSNGHHLIKALKYLHKDSVLCSFGHKEYVQQPTYLSLQVDDEKHIHLLPEFLQYINHSCDPNVFFDTKKWELIALKDIAENEEINFFYPSTEWKMTQPFNCFCGAFNCLGKIQGASCLPIHVIEKYDFSDHIEKKLSKTLIK